MPVFSAALIYLAEMSLHALTTATFRTPRSLDHGDSVVALARSDTSADSAFDAANGHHIQVLRGDLSDPVILAKGESLLCPGMLPLCAAHHNGAH